MPSVVSMFSGSPGAGKTTMCVQVADALSENPENLVLFNSAEQTQDQIAHLCKGRLDLKNGFLFTNYKKWEEIKLYALKLVAENPGKNIIVMIDSLSKLAGSRRSEAQRISDEFINVCQKTNIAGLMVVHLTKNGQFAGNNSMLHDFDSYFHLHVEDEEDDDGFRILQSRKNRFGKKRQAFTFITDAGHTYGEQVEGDSKN